MIKQEHTKQKAEDEQDDSLVSLFLVHLYSIHSHPPIEDFQAKQKQV